MGLAATAALVLALGAGGPSYQALAAPPDQTGYAVRYAPGRMEKTADVRGLAHRPCMVAWTAAADADIGETWLRVAGPAGALDCLVIDLPQRRDRPALERRGIVVELGYPSRWICGTGWSGRARDCKVKVWVIPE